MPGGSQQAPWFGIRSQVILIALQCSDSIVFPSSSFSTISGLHTLPSLNSGCAELQMDMVRKVDWFTDNNRADLSLSLICTF